MNRLSATVTITGVRPILWHAFGPDAIPADGKRERTGVAGNDPIEWSRSVLMTSDRQLYLLPTYIFGCLRDGARHTKKGRGTVQAALAATLQVPGEWILVDRYVPDPPTTDPAAPVYIHVSSVRNPATKARNVRYRIAAAPGWALTFMICWDKTIVSRQEMEAIIHDAGQLVGLGDGRSIGFGRFVVESLVVQDGR